MSGAHRLPRRRRLAGRIIPVGVAAAASVMLSAPGVALALFSGLPPARTASVTAATIGPPTNFTATATGSTTAGLSWTAPSALTGYTLSQSPGTLAGCSATPSAGTASCTATGLSPGTSYTWTLTAVYNNWKSASVQASATTFQVVHATLAGSAPDTTSGSQTTTVSNVTTTNGARLLILAYRQGTSGNLAISSITGTAVSSTPVPASITSEPFNASGGAKFAVIAWQATGTGTTNGTVVVKFSAANNVSTVIDVVQLSGYNTSGPIAGSAVSTGTGSPAVGGSLSPGTSSDGEVFFVGLSAATSLTTPSGYTVLDVPASAAHGSWSSSSASTSGAVTTLGASVTWGTIEIEISHG